MLTISAFLMLIASSSPTIGMASSTFQGTPLMAIAYCESTFQQFNPDGTLLTHFNKNGTFDVGFMQINSIWEDQSQLLGFDLNQEQGNLDFALWLYNTHGISQWNSSKSCWLKYVGNVSSSTPS